MITNAILPAVAELFVDNKWRLLKVYRDKRKKGVRLKFLQFKYCPELRDDPEFVGSFPVAAQKADVKVIKTFLRQQKMPVQSVKYFTGIRCTGMLAGCVQDYVEIVVDHF
jgi:hypothetical protein